MVMPSAGTKHLIEDYIDEVVRSLETIDGDDSGVLSFEEKSDFFLSSQSLFWQNRIDAECIGLAVLFSSWRGAGPF